MVMITLYARQQKRHRCIEWILDSEGEGEGGMIWENGIETCVISYIKRIASPGSMQDTECLELDWWFISYMILYMFKCHSPKSSHPFPLPQSPKVCSIHLCLFCCLALESPLECKEIQPVHLEVNQSWVFIGRTDVEAETPILWPPDAESWLIGKGPDVGKDWGQEEKGMTDE